MLKKYLCILLVLVCQYHSFSQKANMTLYVIPSYVDFSKSIAANEVEKIAPFKILIKEEIDNQFKTLNELLSKREFTEVADTVFGVDFRILCIFNYDGRKTKIYFNYLGDFLLNKQRYHDENVKKIVYNYIPKLCL